MDTCDAGATNMSGKTVHDDSGGSGDEDSDKGHLDSDSTGTQSDAGLGSLVVSALSCSAAETCDDVVTGGSTAAA